MKITVRIHTNHGLEIKTVKVRAGNKLRLAKNWEPKLVDFETKHLWLGRVRFYTDINENASKTWTYGSSLTAEQQPELSQEEVTRFSKAAIFKRRYQLDEKPMPTWLLYLILVVQIGSVIVTYLLVTGRLRV